MEHLENIPLRDDSLNQKQDSANNPEDEGHVKEWQDRSRVVLDAKESAQEPGSPKQSPFPGQSGYEEEKGQQGNQASY